MEKRIENSISMFKTVYTVCNLNLSTISTNVGLANTYAQFVLLLDSTLPIAQRQIINRKGVAMDKKQARENLILAIETAAGIIKAHFDSVSNNDIFVSVNVSFTRLRKMRDMLLVVHAQTVRELLITHQATLAPFGVDAAYITNFTALLTVFSDIVEMPTAARNNKGAATTELKNKIKAIAKFLNNELDNAMYIIKLSNPDVYLTYRNARRTVDNGLRHKNKPKGTINGVVKDEVAGTVLEGALVELLNTDLITSTNALGEFVISTAPGAYTVRVSKLDYEETEVHDILVVKDEDVDVEILLPPLV